MVVPKGEGVNQHMKIHMLHSLVFIFLIFPKLKLKKKVRHNGLPYYHSGPQPSMPPLLPTFFTNLIPPTTPASQPSMPPLLPTSSTNLVPPTTPASQPSMPPLLPTSSTNLVPGTQPASQPLLPFISPLAPKNIFEASI